VLVLNKKLKIFINYFLGPVLFIWLTFSLYQHISEQPNLEQAWSEIKTSLYGSQWWKILLVLVLMALNWGMEALKWKVLVQHIQPISFFTAYKAVLAGQSFAMNTPNRIGEYLGRVIYIGEGNRLRAIVITFIGSISQLIVTIVLGCVSLVFLQHLLSDATSHQSLVSLIWIRATIGALLAVSAILLVVYFKISAIINLLEKIPFVARFSYFLQKLEEFKWRELLDVLSLSLLRFSIFIVQYYLLLQVFNVNIDFWLSAGLTCIMFLAMAVVPTIALAELGLRGKLAVLLFGVASTNTLGIVLTASGIWLINLVVPALAGSLFILGVKLFRNKK
jgi:uncharacterized membrane protein YbhN (UPF0104 family)